MFRKVAQAALLVSLLSGVDKAEVDPTGGAEPRFGMLVAACVRASPVP
jgi:hypothetical protein